MDFYAFCIGLLAYLIGALPTGYLIAQIKGIADIRSHGSGNIGATNVSRLLGLHYFFIVFLLDAGKAYLFIQAIKSHFDFTHVCLFAAMLLIGNGFSVFLNGSGGKGVATLMGLLTALHSQTVFIILCIWFIFLFITRTVGIASVGAAIWLPFVAYTTHNTSFFLFSLFATAWIIQKHHKNLAAYWNKE